MKKIKLLNKSIVPLEEIQTALPLEDTKLAKAIGVEHTANLQALLDTTPNKRWAFFFQKYARLVRVASLTYRGTSKYIAYQSKGEIHINIQKDSQFHEPYTTTVHECTHAIDFCLSAEGFEHAKKSAYDVECRLSYSELEVYGEKATLFDAIEEDREYLKGKFGISKIADLKTSVEGLYAFGYDLPLMVLGGENTSHRCEYFAVLGELAIAYPSKYTELKSVIPNVVNFFEVLMEYLTPDYNPATVHVIKAKFKYNAKGKLLINFNGQYSIAEMMQRLQNLGGLSFKAAYSTLMRAVKHGKAIQSSLEFEDAPDDYQTAAWRIKQMAELIITKRQVSPEVKSAIA